MPEPSPFFRIRAAMKVSDPGTACVGNNLPQPEGPIEGWDPAEIAIARVLVDQRDLYEDLSRHRLIVSPRLQAMLREGVAEQVQFLPVRLLSGDGAQERPGFAILSALNVFTPAEARAHAERETLYRTPLSAGDVRMSLSLKERCAGARLRGVEFV